MHELSNQHNYSSPLTSCSLFCPLLNSQALSLSVIMGKFISFLTYALPVLAVVMYLSPFVTIHVIILLDFFTPFSAFKSEWVANYHNSLVEKLPIIPAKELYEIPIEELTKDELRIRSNEYTTPVVVRNALAGSDILKKWNNISWWVENYGDEEVICKYVESGTDEKKCTVKEALSPEDPSKRMYVSGEARMFMRRPELAAMVKTELVKINDLMSRCLVFH